MDVLASRNTNLFSVQMKTVFFWILLHATVTCESYEFDMQDYCDKEISMTQESVYQVELELEDTNIYDRRNGTCETTLGAWYSPYNKLMVYFDDFDLDCEDGHLEFYTGRTGHSRVNGLERDICGENKPQDVFDVDDIYFRVKYVPKKINYSKDVFTVIITAYGDDGNCDDFSHKCDQSRCINKDIDCNVVVGCGGGGFAINSVVVLGIVGSLVVLGIVVCVIVCCVCCRRKKSKAPGTIIIQANGSMAVGYNASGHVGFHQPTYDVNYEGSYPTYPSPYSKASASMPPTHIPPGQQHGYDQTHDLPPPYSEVAHKYQGNNQSNGVNQPQGLESPDKQSIKQQEPIYEGI